MNLRLFPLLLSLALAPTFAHAQTQSLPDVQKATESVYRIWLGMPLPTGFVKQTDGSHIQALQTQKFAENVPLKGMSLQNKKTGKRQALSGEGILFQHAGHHYLLIASGSAYAISDKGHLITNAKLTDNTGNTEAMFIDESGLRDLGENGGQVQAFVLTKKTNATALDLQALKPIARDLTHDLAIVQAENLPTKALKLADTQFAKPAEQVFALGAEGEFDQLSGKQNAIDRVDYAVATAHEGKLEKRVKQKNTQVWLHNAPVSGSLSGGALVNQCGQVLGINQLGGASEGYAQAIDVGQVLPMLRKHSVPFQQYQGRCGGVVAKAENIVDGAERIAQSAQHNPRGWLTVLGLGILTLIACAVAWRMLRWTWQKKRQNPIQRAVSAPPVSQSQVHISPNQPVNMNNVNANPHTQIHAPHTVLDNTAMTLVAVSGSLNSIAVPHQHKITLGRNPNCDIVLSHPKVSGTHAKLWVKHGALWVQDLGSTNGTFINDVRIHVPTQIQTGDTVQFTGDNSVARFRLPETPSRQTVTAPHTELHRPTPLLAAVLQPMSANLARVDIPFSGSLNLGRAPDNDVVIAVPQVSGQHCRIGADAQGVLFVQDLNSTNGTFVNQLNHRVSQTTLKIGDVVYLADQNTAYRVQAA